MSAHIENYLLRSDYRGKDYGRKKYAELGRTGVTMQQILKRYGIASIQELDQVTYKRALNGLKRTKNAA